MSNLTITRPPQFLDPWFTEIEQVWDEIEASVNDIETRVEALESTPSTPVWGNITGTLSAQTDLQSALNGKAPATLSSYSANAGTPTNGDTVQQAIAKLDGNQVANLCQVLTFVATGGGYTATGTYAVPTGMTAQTINIPFTGTFLLDLFMDAYNSGGTDVNFFFGVQVDGGTIYEIPSLQMQNTYYNSRPHGKVKVTLSAGNHTFAPVVKFSGSGAISVPSAANWTTQLTITGQGFAGNTTTPQFQYTAAMTANQTVSSGYPTVTDITDLFVSFNTTVSNQQVWLEVLSIIQAIGGTGTDTYYIFYKLDGGAYNLWIPDEVTPSNFCDTYAKVPLTVSSPGMHTIQIGMTRGGTNIAVQGDGTFAKSRVTVSVADSQGTLVQTQPIKYITNISSQINAFTASSATDIPGYSVNFTTTIPNQQVDVIANVWTETDVAANTMFCGYVLDANSFKQIGFMNCAGIAEGGFIGGSFSVVVATPGNHTIKLQAYQNATPSPSMTIFASPTCIAGIQVTTYPQTALTFSNPMGAPGDMIYGTTGGLPQSFNPKWQGFTVNGSWGNVTYTGFKKMKDPYTWQFRIFMLLTNSPTPNGTQLLITLPVTIDYSVLPAGNINEGDILGTARYIDASGAPGSGRHLGQVMYWDPNTIALYLQSEGASDLRIANTGDPIAFAGSDRIFLEFEVPVTL